MKKIALCVGAPCPVDAATAQIWHTSNMKIAMREVTS